VQPNHRHGCHPRRQTINIRASITTTNDSSVFAVLISLSAASSRPAVFYATRLSVTWSLALVTWHFWRHLMTFVNTFSLRRRAIYQLRVHQTWIICQCYCSCHKRHKYSIRCHMSRRDVICLSRYVVFFIMEAMLHSRPVGRSVGRPVSDVAFLVVVAECR